MVDASGTVPAQSNRYLVEYYTVELSQLADNGIHVSVVATTVDEEEPQLLSQDIISTRVDSIDQALEVIRCAVSEQI